MAGPFYVDPAAAGINDGSSWTNAWTSLQSAADTAVAGEIVYCRGTQTLSGAAIDFDTNAGTNAAGWIKFIGCNASGNVDGTRFILDANGGSHHVISFTTTAKMVWFENVETKNAGTGTYHGFNIGTFESQGCVFINCCANGCSNGFSLSGATEVILFRCISYSNDVAGFALNSSARSFFSAARDNADDGFINGRSIIGCVSHGNTQEGFSGLLAAASLFNCVCDGNTDDGIELANHTSLYGALILGCRITNHSGSGDIGLNGAADGNDEPFITGFNYFENNDGDNIQNATLHQFIPLEGGSGTSNIEDQSNTNQGYVDPTNHDFSTGYTDSGDPDLRRTAITIPWS